MKVLIVDDNKQITAILEAYARKEGYETLIADDGEEALTIFKNELIDIVLLDVMMPKVDGFEVCRQIRKISTVPIIMITARGEDFEKIMGLEIGADDYIVKPFSPAEIMARIKAILRRIKPQTEQANIYVYDNLQINLTTYTVMIDGKIISLTKKEIELLWTLATNQNVVFSRDMLLNKLWGYDYLGDTRTVDSHIKRLRAKLDKAQEKVSTWEIKTIWGVGYKFEVDNNV